MKRSLLTIAVVLRAALTVAQQYEPAWVPLDSAEIQKSIDSHLAFESDSPDSLICYRGYVVKYDYVHRVPLFTVHRLTPEQIDPEHGPPARRLSTFIVDETNLGMRSAMAVDYSKSGWDRGHIVPAGDFQWSQPLKNETFLSTNITPQNPNLNRGIWAGMENEIRFLVAEYEETAIIVTGVMLADDSTSIGPEKVGVPTHLYKLVYLPKRQVMYAFLFDNRIGSYNAAISEFQVTVDEIESITRLDFFDRLEDEFEAKLEGQRVMINEGR